MSNRHHHERIVNPARDGWARYDAEEILREMILGEIKSGRVSRAHYTRIVRFAGELGICEAAAAELIADCCRAALAENDSKARQHAAQQWSPRTGAVLRACLIIAGIVAAELALIFWLYT